MTMSELYLARLAYEANVFYELIQRAGYDVYHISLDDKKVFLKRRKDGALFVVDVDMSVPLPCCESCDERPAIFK